MCGKKFVLSLLSLLLCLPLLVPFSGLAEESPPVPEPVPAGESVADVSTEQPKLEPEVTSPDNGLGENAGEDDGALEEEPAPTEEEPAVEPDAPPEDDSQDPAAEITPFAIPGSQQISAIFPDPNLAQSIANWVSPSRSVNDYVTQAELSAMTSLYLSETPIRNLEGIQHLNRIENLDFSSNQIVDITPLAGMINLKVLNKS